MQPLGEKINIDFVGTFGGQVTGLPINDVTTQKFIITHSNLRMSVGWILELTLTGLIGHSGL